MQLEWLTYFLETAKDKSLSKASQRLNLSQPALSKLIRNLERELGVTLFHRTVAGIELTESGIYFQAKIKPILNELQVVFGDLQGFSTSGQLKLGLVSSLATYYLPVRISSLRQSFPFTDLMVGSTSDEVLSWLGNGEIQVAICEKKPSVKHLWKALLFEEPYYCVVPETSGLGQRGSVNIRDICDEAFVVYPSGCDIRNCLTRNFAEIGVTPTIALEIPFSESLLSFVSAGAGIAIVPQLVANQVHRYGLHSVKIEDFKETRKIYVIAHSDRTGKLVHQRLTKSEIVKP